MSGLMRSFEADFSALALAQPERVALIVPAEIDPVHISYERLWELTRRCLAYYEGRGLKPGDVVFSLMPNAAETLVAFLAAVLGGYGFAPLPCVASRREIGRWLDLTRPRLCLTTALVAEENLGFLRERGIPTELILADARFLWLPPNPAAPRGAKGARVYLSTSGTTGEPKAMVLDADTLWSSGHAFLKFHGLLESRLTFWNYLPMSYLGGLFNLGLIPLCAGGSVVVDETFSGKTLLEFWQTVERFGVDALWLVPAIARGLLRLAERTERRGGAFPGGRIKAAFIGTSPIDLETKRRFELAFGFPILENFALSETTFFTSETPANRASRREGSVGEILPYADVTFTRAAGEGGACREIGVRSPFLFRGYLQADGSLALPLDEKGYFRTGDAGVLGPDNVLVITGRLKDFIKKGGYLVPLREIELLAEQHPAVREAAAVPAPHPFYGESFNLYLALKEGRDGSALDEIGRHIHDNLVKYKWPDKLIVVKDFPRTPSGKIRKLGIPPPHELP